MLNAAAGYCCCCCAATGHRYWLSRCRELLHSCSVFPSMAQVQEDEQVQDSLDTSVGMYVYAPGSQFSSASGDWFINPLNCPPESLKRLTEWEQLEFIAAKECMEAGLPVPMHLRRTIEMVEAPEDQQEEDQQEEDERDPYEKILELERKTKMQMLSDSIKAMKVYRELMELTAAKRKREEVHIICCVYGLILGVRRCA